MLLWCFLFPQPEGKNYFQGRCNVRELVLEEENLLVFKVQLGLGYNLFGKLRAGRHTRSSLPASPFWYKEQG